MKGDQIQRPGLAVPGLLLLVAGLVGIAFNGQVANIQNHRQASECLAPLLWSICICVDALRGGSPRSLCLAERRGSVLQWPTRKTRNWMGMSLHRLAPA